MSDPESGAPGPRRRSDLDTSAYLCVLLGEKGHESLVRELSGAILPSSVLIVPESTRNLVRMAREGILACADPQRCLQRLGEDREQSTVRDLTLDLCTGTRMPVVTTPCSLDLAHLRTALWFHEIEPLARFVSLDEGQNQAAREIGLPA